jgi:Zn-dependent protease with chaperone function
MRNFLEHQERAWDKSAKFLTLLAFAVVATVVLTGLVVTYLFVLLLLCSEVDPANFRLQMLEMFLIVCTTTSILMAVSSIQKFRQLRAGGRVIAEDLGGEPIDEHTQNRRQKRLLNIVDEMAVASGIPAPTVYVLPKQPGINAFAAGIEFDDAIVAVTQGCIQRLNRDQLQGVIAHEFSHILNGDMRLNMRLVGLLHGVLGITLFAEALLQMAHELTTTTRNHRDALTEVVMGVVLSLAGILLWPVGLVGSLFGTIVMSATSRQREFLADAFAVQLTRNPEGIAAALKVLAGCDAGSRVRSSKSIEASHFFFAPGCLWMSRLLATHPPLAERIRRLDPQWDGLPLFEDIDPVDQDPDEVTGLAALVGSQVVTSRSGPDAADRAGDLRASEDADHDAETPVWSVGADAGRDTAARVFATIPAVWLELVEDTAGGPLLLAALWIDATHVGADTLAQLPEADRRIVEQLLGQLKQLDAAQLMLLFDLASERIERLPLDDRQAVRMRFERLLETSDPSDFATWALGWYLRRALGALPTQSVRPRYGKLVDVQQGCEVLLSMACHCGSSHDAMAGYAFQRAVVSLELRDPEFWSRADLSCERLDAALQLVAELAPRPRQQFLAAVERSLSADHGMTVGESQFVRGMCAALNLPIPAWLPGQLIAHS